MKGRREEREERKQVGSERLHQEKNNFRRKKRKGLRKE